MKSRYVKWVVLLGLAFLSFLFIISILSKNSHEHFHSISTEGSIDRGRKNSDSQGENGSGSKSTSHLGKKGLVTDSQIRGLAPDAARAELQKAELITNLLDQVKAYMEITRRLCEAGYFEEAWQMILNEPGANRSAQLGVFFSLTPLDFRLCVSKIENLPDSVEKKVAIQSYLGGHFQQFSKLMEDINFKRMTQELSESDPNALASIIAGGLRISFDAASESEKEEINKFVLEYHSQNLISDFDFSTMVTRNASKPPFELWSWISDSSMGVKHPESFEGQLRTAIVQNMVLEDAPKALSEFSASREKSSAADLYSGLSQWASMDSKAANAWYLSNRFRLTEDQQDAAAKTFSTLALTYGETEGAESWANKINNVDLRKSLLEKIHPSPPEN